MKCSWDVERSLRFAAFHFLMNAEGVMRTLCLMPSCIRVWKSPK
jgi:hypothetical protein